MPIGDNISFGEDQLIRKTVESGRKTGLRAGRPEPEPAARRKDTRDTVKMTFYVKRDFLGQLYNFAYWERLSVTAAFNRVMSDGLRHKDTRPRPGEELPGEATGG